MTDSKNFSRGSSQWQEGKCLSSFILRSSCTWSLASRTSTFQVFMLCVIVKWLGASSLHAEMLTVMGFNSEYVTFKPMIKPQSWSRSQSTVTATVRGTLLSSYSGRFVLTKSFLLLFYLILRELVITLIFRIRFFTLFCVVWLLALCDSVLNSIVSPLHYITTAGVPWNGYGNEEEVPDIPHRYR